MTLGAQAKVAYQFAHEDNILVELFTLRTSEDNLNLKSFFDGMEASGAWFKGLRIS